MVFQGMGIWHGVFCGMGVYFCETLAVIIPSHLYGRAIKSVLSFKRFTIFILFPSILSS